MEWGGEGVIIVQSPWIAGDRHDIITTKGANQAIAEETLLYSITYTWLIEMLGF